MTIPSAKYLKLKAGKRLESGQEPKKVVLVYAGFTALLSLLITIVRYILANQISQTGGLSNIGLRSILSTIDNVLPIIETIIVMCLGLGYLAAMLRIARWQYASPKTLKAGFERFWPLLFSKVIQGLIYAGIGFAIFYAAIAVFFFSPFSTSFMEAVTPLVSDPSFSPEILMDNPEILDSLLGPITPLFVIYLLIYIPLLLVVSYRYRMTDCILIDQPGCGAVQAMRQSRKLMRGNRLNLFKVDLSFWWYYGLQTLATLLLYIDLILAVFGITIPFSGTVRLIAISTAYLGANFAIQYFFLNYYTVTQALAYHSIVPKQEQEGAVLGNIFQM